jgi:hypothetical protein
MFQQHIATILEDRATEAEKFRHLICNHLHPATFDNHSDQIRESLDVHRQLIEVINGLTKMENALAKNLEILLGGNEEDSGGTASGFPGIP